MVRDPREGVAADGTIVTGVSVDRIPDVYVEVIDDAVTTLTASLGPTLHSIYLYGSIATGEARPPDSDLDLVVALRSPAEERVARAAAELTERHRWLVREVGVGSVELASLRGDDPAATADRCFLRHYALHLAGPDVRDDAPPCRATLELAVGFNGDLGDALARIRSRVSAASDDRERGELATRACRKMLMAAATLLSVEEGGWSTAREDGVALVTRREPELADLAETALAWCTAPPAPRAASEVVHVVDRLGGWLTERYARARADDHDGRTVSDGEQRPTPRTGERTETP